MLRNYRGASGLQGGSHREIIAQFHCRGVKYTGVLLTYNTSYYSDMLLVKAMMPACHPRDDSPSSFLFTRCRFEGHRDDKNEGNLH